MLSSRQKYAAECACSSHEQGAALVTHSHTHTLTHTHTHNTHTHTSNTNCTENEVNIRAHTYTHTQCTIQTQVLSGLQSAPVGADGAPQHADLTGGFANTFGMLDSLGLGHVLGQQQQQQPMQQHIQQQQQPQQQQQEEPFLARQRHILESSDQSLIAEVGDRTRCSCCQCCCKSGLCTDRWKPAVRGKL